MKTVLTRALSTAVLLAAATSSFAQPAKNVILLVSDGAGWAPHQATELWTGSAEPYNNSNWTQSVTSTYNLRSSAGSLSDNNQDPNLVYDPAKYWDTTPGTTRAFAGYDWSATTAPDSAGTMSAMVTGEKVYKGGMNVDGFGNPLVTAAEVAKSNGKTVGSISSVRYNHATVAAGAGAHNISRNNYLDLSYEMFAAGVADVVGGAGHPFFNDDGTARAQDPGFSNSRFDEALWNTMSSGSGTASRTTVDGRNYTVDGSDWSMFNTKADIEALANGTLSAAPGTSLVMIPEVYSTLQVSRPVSGTAVKPYDDALNTHVPTLADMTNASLNHLDDDPDGFFLAIEGGAVDWADHGDNSIRVIEEQIGFNDAVQAVVDYLDAGTNGNDWSNTLVIVTADHDHITFGENSDTTDPFADVTTVDPVTGMPIMVHHSTGHGNALVPTWTRGVNADDINDADWGTDSVYGVYNDQTQIGAVVLQNVPEPTSLALLGLGGLLVARRRRA